MRRGGANTNDNELSEVEDNDYEDEIESSEIITNRLNYQNENNY